MMIRHFFPLSMDNKKWKMAVMGEFGNIINNPIKQKNFF